MENRGRVNMRRRTLSLIFVVALAAILMWHQNQSTKMVVLPRSTAPVDATTPTVNLVANAVEVEEATDGSKVTAAVHGVPWTAAVDLDSPSIATLEQGRDAQAMKEYLETHAPSEEQLPRLHTGTLGGSEGPSSEAGRTLWTLATHPFVNRIVVYWLGYPGANGVYCLARFTVTASSPPLSYTYSITQGARAQVQNHRGERKDCDGRVGGGAVQ